MKRIKTILSAAWTYFDGLMPMVLAGISLWTKQDIYVFLGMFLLLWDIRTEVQRKLVVYLKDEASK